MPQCLHLHLCPYQYPYQQYVFRLFLNEDIQLDTAVPLLKVVPLIDNLISITFSFPFRSFSFCFSFTESLSSFFHFFFPWNVDLLIRSNIRNTQTYFCTMTVFHCI